MNFNINDKNLILARGIKLIFLFTLFSGFSKEAVARLSDDIKNRDIFAFEFLTYNSFQPEKSFLEVFCQIPTNDLQFVKFKEGFFGSYQLSISLHDKSGRIVLEQSHQDSVKVKAFSEIDIPRPYQLIRFTFLVEPGEYEANISLSDIETLRSLELKKIIQIPDYSVNTLSLSDLQIATSIRLSSEEDFLVKSGRRIEPNVARIILPSLDAIYVYYEIYNLQFSQDKPNKGSIVTYIIEDEKGEEIKSAQLRIKKPGKTCALSVKLSVDALETGQYQLTLRVEDLDSGQQVEKSTNFLVLKPGLTRNQYVARLAEAYGKDTLF